MFHLVRVASDDPSIADPDVIDLASIETAITLVRWFCREVDRAYAILRGGEDDRDRPRLEPVDNARHAGVTSVGDLTHGLRACTA